MLSVVVAFVVGLVVGAGLTYGFRGAILREKAALKASAGKAAQDTLKKV